jgi:hypothetical protein
LIERSINILITLWPLSRPRLITNIVITNIDREIVILLYQRFWSQIEAVMEATGIFIKLMCVCYMHINFS